MLVMDVWQKSLTVLNVKISLSTGRSLQIQFKNFSFECASKFLIWRLPRTDCKEDPCCTKFKIILMMTIIERCFKYFILCNTLVAEVCNITWEIFFFNEKHDHFVKFMYKTCVMFLVIWIDALWSIYVSKHFLLCNRLQLGAGYTDLCSNDIPGFCPGQCSNTFVLRNTKLSFRFFLICTLFGYLQWRSVFKEHCRWTTWWSDSLLPNETLLVFCLCFPTRFLTQQTWFRNCILWEKKLLNYE